jgi:putative peptidoglycan lipid II flippase
MYNVLQVGLQWWGTWQTQSVNRRIFSALMTVGGLTALAKVASAGKDVVVAYQFGAGDEFDAFLIAFLIPSFAINLVGGSLNVALIPTYIEVREQEGSSAANRLMSSTIAITTLCLVALSLVLAFTASHILSLVASGFSEEKLALSRSLYLILLGTLILQGISTTWGGVLNAVNRFALVAAVPVVTPIVMLAAVLTFAHSYGAHVLALGLVGGALIETGVIGWALMREGVSLLPRWGGLTPAVRQVLGQYVPMVIGAFLMGGTGIVSQSMAATLDPGSVSELAYGSKITNLLLGIGATAVSTAVLPHFSQLVAVADWAGVKRTLATYARLLLMCTIPVTLMLIYFSETIVAILFQRGAFTEADTRIVAPIQVMYLIQVPIYIVGMLFVRLVSALKANHVMMWGNVINLGLCILLTYVLMQWIGVTGIALATSLIYVFNTSFLCVMVWWLMKKASDGGEAAIARQG